MEISWDKRYANPWPAEFQFREKQDKAALFFYDAELFARKKAGNK
jgi:hypothetical protein